MMRTPPKLSIRLLVTAVSCIGLLIVFCDSVLTQETKKANPKVQELQKQRLAVLEEIRDSAKNLYSNASVDVQAVIEAERALVNAHLAYAETHQDRIKACEDAIAHATKWYEFAKVRTQAARGTEIDVLKAEAFMLEVQIMRENAETNE